MKITDTLGRIILSIIERWFSFRDKKCIAVHVHVGWCIGKCPLYRGVLYSKCPLSEVPLYTHHTTSITYHMLIEVISIIKCPKIDD